VRIYNEVGGGIYNVGEVILNDLASVTRNTASVRDGGIFNDESLEAKLIFGTGWEGTVSGNEPDDISSSRSCSRAKGSR
jgi:hypothetical protein